MFVPTDNALLDYRGVRGEDFALNHIVNSVEVEVIPGSKGNVGKLNNLVFYN